MNIWCRKELIEELFTGYDYRISKSPYYRPGVGLSWSFGWTEDDNAEYIPSLNEDEAVNDFRYALAKLLEAKGLSPDDVIIHITHTPMFHYHFNTWHGGEACSVVLRFSLDKKT